MNLTLDMMIEYEGMDKYGTSSNPCSNVLYHEFQPSFSFVVDELLAIVAYMLLIWVFSLVGLQVSNKLKKCKYKLSSSHVK